MGGKYAGVAVLAERRPRPDCGVMPLIPKPSRIRNPKLLASMRGQPCAICGRPGVAHHLKTAGSGGDDVPENLICLCTEHHREAHQLGRHTWAAKYELVQ